MSLPLSTYRMQLRPGFGFDQAAALADYLTALGVSHLYASPYLQAAPGSTHGYDVLDHSQPSEELGGWGGHERFCHALGENDLGQVIDVVPNHMSIASHKNRWWWDVLENGQLSRYASYFDVDWHPPEERLRNNVVLPILGNHFGRVLEGLEIQLVREGSTFTFHYHDHIFPAAPSSLVGVMMAAANRAHSDELAFLAEIMDRLNLPPTADRRALAIRHRDKEVLGRMLQRLLEEQPDVARTFDEVIAEVNTNPQTLGRLLDQQNYRLAFWKTAGEELAYRRFFDINTLASLRMEDEQVFEDTHALIFDWLRRGVVDGLRIDHPDGLRDPQQYFERLRARAPEAWIVVEKILQPNEPLRSQWPVHGTTGYDYLNQLAGIFVEREAEEPFTRFYQEFTGETRTFEQVVYDGKQQVLRESFAADVHRLTSMLVEICERHSRYRDYTRRELRVLLREVLASFPVYRTYVQEDRVDDADVACIHQAIELARSHLADIDQELVEFLENLLLLRVPGDIEREFAMRFQQATGAIVAKGVEDTAFYNYNRFIALNEVGGDPGTFGYSLEQYHTFCRQIQEHWPLAMITTTTHDTKRSEDVRARLYALSEIPDAWFTAVKRWAAHNQQHKQDGFPEPNMEYVLYQTIVGAWPIDSERLGTFARKAAREAKVNTSWVAIRTEYEDAVLAFIERILADPVFVRDLEEFVRPLAQAGWKLSLAQALAKLTSPGVPDVYQGNELWDLSLVDPDNRRLVDYEPRRRGLAQLAKMSPEEILERMDQGLPKLWVTRQALHLRRRRPELFGRDGTYEPLMVRGRHADTVLAFMRGGGAITVAPVRTRRAANGWDDTRLELPRGPWINELTGESWAGGEVRLEILLARFPVALLVKE